MNIYKMHNIEQIRLINKDQFDTLYNISSLLNSASFEQSLIDNMLDLLIKVINAERGIFLKVHPNEKLSILSARNVMHENIDDLSAFSSGVIAKVIKNKQPVLYHDVQNAPEVSQYESIQIHNIKSILGVPLLRDNDVWGLIIVDSKINRKEFNEENLTFLNFFSNIASLALDKIEKIEALSDENEILRNQLQSTIKIPELIGNSPAMQRLTAMISKVAVTDATVLLLGESGTGKELIARAIHNFSRRKDKPYLAQFCGSIPDTLLESELFGFKKGAFTGAINDKKGLFEVAVNGTFFLDEIADISLALQAKLLRVLQNKEIMRLGDTTFIKVDVRVIAATNKDLKQLVKDGVFREDLFYRLNVFPIRVPPLRERKGDIPLLIKHFIQKYSENTKIIHPGALKLLEEYHWPGNVRQLENVIQRALIVCENNKILPEHIILEDDDGDEVRFIGTLRDFEKALLLKRLDEFEGNRTLTAQSLGVSVRWVQLKLKEMNSAKGDLLHNESNLN
ncbi:MAG: sigma-54 interaction domain-containing protein [Syntrophothermus sp.]